jgi:hypothetical protein
VWGVKMFEDKLFILIITSIYLSSSTPDDIAKMMMQAANEWRWSSDLKGKSHGEGLKFKMREHLPGGQSPGLVDFGPID